jgi:HPt (histidine-containing phosphotransfer) domain-containing protein
MKYAAYLPDIDIEDGKARVMNNLKLYLRLVGRFDGAKMVGDISAALKAGDEQEVMNAAHALKGTAANLGFPVVQKIAGEIETGGKSEKDYSALIKQLSEATASLAEAIGRFIASQGEETS